MATEPMPLPDDIRNQVRERSYGNRREELDAISAVDDAVFDKVRTHESYLTDVANELNATAEADIAAASDLLHNTTALIQGVERGEVLIDQASAKQYQAARANIAAGVKELRYLKERIHFTSAKAADPYGSMTAILEKFSSLRGGRAWIRDGM